MLVKFCGLQSLADVVYANETRPDYVGFVFAPSKRQVSVQQAATLRAALADGIAPVGVFVNESIESILDAAKRAGLSVIQLHGDEDDAYIAELRAALRRAKAQCQIWKAFRVTDPNALLAAQDSSADGLLLDAFDSAAYGGTGKTANWSLIEDNRQMLTRPFFLAGGLGEENIAEAVRRTSPAGLDISSGIETDGIKDIAKMRRVMERIRGL